MLFNSYVFMCLFLPVTLLVFFQLGRMRLTVAARAWLVLASLGFYAYWNPIYLCLLLLSIWFNYSLGGLICRSLKAARHKRAKVFASVGIAANLGALIYYKYAAFLLGTACGLSGAHLSIPDIILPLGISFFSFTQIAYLVDVYRGEVEDYEPIGYSLFVTFFPHLIAGPILYHKSVIPQFYSPKMFVFNNRRFALGLFVFITGLAKKVLIADNIAPWANVIFEHASRVNIIEAWVGTICYTFQLFYDFCGYSDMALGLGLMLNIALPLNFDVPYRSFSIVEFWRRWHISLSAFLRDYLYIPLGGNRNGEGRRYVNLFLTMLIGGLWHGAGWTFVVWGALHGAYLVINQLWRRLEIKTEPAIAWCCTFASVMVAWVFFRAKTLSDATSILSAMFTLKQISAPYNLKFALILAGPLHIPIRANETYLIGGNTSVLCIVGLFASIWVIPSAKTLMVRFRPTLQYAAATIFLFVLSLLSMSKVSEFLYFQF